MKTAFSVFIAVLLGLVFPVLLLGTVVRFELLNAANLQQVLRDANAGEQAPVVIQNVLEESVEKQQQEEQMNGNEGGSQEENSNEGGGPADLNLTGALTPEKVYAVVDPTIESAIQWLNSGDTTINIAPTKQALRPVFEEALAGQEEKPDLSEIPPFSLEDNVTIGELTGAEEGDDFLQQSPLADLQTWLLIAWTVFGVLTLIILLLQRTPLYHLFAWIGALDVIFAVEAAALALAVMFIPDVVSSFFAEDMNADVQALALSVIEQISALLRTTLLLVTGVLVVKVIIAFALSMWLKKQKR